MKKLLYLFSLLISLCLTSCSEDNSSENNNIRGQWKLVNVKGTIAGINHNFPLGEIIWDINPITQTVTVVNNNTDNALYDVLETGVYNFQVNTNPELPCGESLLVNNIELGCFSINNQNLIIDQSIDDGIKVTLVR
ncbi:hypothetical protein [Flavobacterium sp.]|uniref:hypothetical protein n=1 Tax=Flavobacterium sp. TaxID=239 RepID=UPI0025E0E403|nr:hypothetical protein [Flavobacterium sp.]